MKKRTDPSILQNFDSELASLILNSETHAMLEEDDLKLWHFSPLAIFDIWESEEITGDPRNSFYLRGDEIE